MGKTTPREVLSSDMILYFKFLDGTKNVLNLTEQNIQPSITIEEFKSKVYEAKYGEEAQGNSSFQWRFIYKGKELKNQDLLESYDIPCGETIFITLVLRQHQNDL